MKKNIFALILLSMLSFSSYAYSQSISKDLESSLIRLHILADSNSEHDQNIKIAVRNDVLKAVSGISVKDTEFFRMTAENAANKYLAENNVPYRATALYGKFNFPQKTYKNITLPSGEYYGIRIILGKGNGENWWCVMYPPLCIADDGEPYIDTDADNMLKKELNHDTYELITDKTPKIKFKIVEWFQSII